MTPTDISDKQLAANRANAQHSTGPKTAEGKSRARYNGTKHGLTGRTVVLPWEDLEEYKRFSEELVESFAPKTPFERQLAQTVADAQWRLNRARTWEEGIICVGVHGPVGDIDTADSRIYSALAESQVFLQNSKSFANLTLYEQRLHRQQKQALEQLERLQTARKTEEKAAMEQAKLLFKQHKMKGIPVSEPVRPYPREVEERRKASGQGFAFSAAEIEAECLRDRRLEEAEIARIVDYNLKNYEIRVARLAA